MKILKFLKKIGNFILEMATLHHEMETGRLTCPNCRERQMSVRERGIMPVGVCGNCKFELNI